MIFEVASYKNNNDMEGMDELFYIVSDQESSVLRMLQSFADKEDKVLCVDRHPGLEYEAYKREGGHEYSVFIMENLHDDSTILYPENCPKEIIERWQSL